MNAQPPAYLYADVAVLVDGQVVTPQGYSHVSNTEFTLGPPASITRSRSEWNTGMVIVSILVALFTCGLGLILLFLSRTDRIYTEIVDTVSVQGPNYVYHAQAPGGGHFVSWVNTWKHQFKAQTDANTIREALPTNVAPTPSQPVPTTVISAIEQVTYETEVFDGPGSTQHVAESAHPIEPLPDAERLPEKD